MQKAVSSQGLRKGDGETKSSSSVVFHANFTRIYVGHGDMDLYSGAVLHFQKYATGRIQSFPKRLLKCDAASQKSPSISEAQISLSITSAASVIS